jgi:zinc/manganese transport system substrate-binding protein
MKRTLRYLARATAALLVATLAIGVSACSMRDSTSKTSAPAPSGPITVVSSLGQWGSLVQQIGGDQVKVTSILTDVSTDARTFEPSGSNVESISNAGMLVVNGAGYDSWASKLIGKSTVLISAADTVGASEGDNPYLWFSKEARKSVATEIAESLSKVRPSEKSYFHRQLATWQKSETSVESSITAFAKTHRNLSYAATDATAYYLMADLGFKDATPESYQRSTQSGGEATTSDIKEFTTLLEKQRIDLLITTPDASQSGSDENTEDDNAESTLVSQAQHAGIPVIGITAQMPDASSTLTQWVEDLIGNISDNTAKSDVAAPPSPAASTVPNESGSQSQ